MGLSTPSDILELEFLRIIKSQYEIIGENF